MAGDLGQVGKATVTIDADMSPFDRAMAALPAKGAANAKAAIDRIKREMQANSASIAGAILSQKTAGAGNAGRDQYNRAAVSIDKFREANRDLQAQLDQVAASVQRKAAIVTAMAEKEAAAVTASAAKQSAAMQQAAQQAAVLAGQGAMVGNQFVAFTTKATATAGAIQNVGKSSGNAGYAILELSRGIEDAQYGLGGILNNIPGLVLAMGGTGGLAGVISIVAVGANLLYKNWDKVATLWEDEATTREAKRQRDLAEAADEATQAIEGELKAIAKMKGEETDVRASALREASARVGGDRAVADIEQRMGETQSFMPGTNLGDREHTRDQARRLLAEATSGTNPRAAVKLDVLMSTAGKENGFGEAYRDTRKKSLTTEEKAAEEEKKKEQDLSDKAGQQAMSRAEAYQKKLEQEEQGRIKNAADNASPAARKMVLEAAAGGAELDRKRLGEQMTQDLIKGGVDPKDAGKLGADAAKELGDAIGKKLTEDATRNGSTKERTAQAGLVEMQVENARRTAEMMQANLEDTKKDIKEARVMSSGELSQALLSARPKSAEDLAKKQLDEAQKAVKRLEEIRDNLSRGVPARIGG